MSSRQEKLSYIKEYIKDTNKEVTMILQSLQWDRKQLLESTSMTFCKYNSNHKIPIKNKKEHEDRCVLKCQGYSHDDLFLPDVFDTTANTIVKFTPDNIHEIISYASKVDLQFKTGNTYLESEPLTLERLQATYTADERRAIYDAVVSTAPSCHDLSDLALTDNVSDPTMVKRKSRLEILAELRDMKRRRARYRVSVPTRNYSHVLRDLIATQMEMYKEIQTETKNKLPADEPHKRTFSDGKDNLKKLDRTEKTKSSYVENKKRKYDDKSSTHSKKYENRKDDRKRNSATDIKINDSKYEKNREEDRKVRTTKESYDKTVRREHNYERNDRDRKLTTNGRLSINYEGDRSSSRSRDRHKYHNNETSTERKRYYDERQNKKKIQ